MPEKWELNEKWRPKNWENPYFIVERVGMDTETSYNKYPEFQVFEDGATAILKAYQSYLQQGDRREAIAGELFDIWKEAKEDLPDGDNWNDQTWEGLPEKHKHEYYLTADRIISLFPAPVAPKKLKEAIINGDFIIRALITDWENFLSNQGNPSSPFYSFGGDKFAVIEFLINKYLPLLATQIEEARREGAKEFMDGRRSVIEQVNNLFGSQLSGGEWSLLLAELQAGQSLPDKVEVSHDRTEEV